ncbi:hypothetical protein, partial [Campylobacter troglodytis]|uniref:hypothetical protein n=1 Tax=Campylobacter troglodytis TaxID=654363 RepID=UPI001158605F
MNKKYIDIISFKNERSPDLIDQQMSYIFLDYMKYLDGENEQLKQISTTLTLKGKLRISWSFDIKYNKNIDLIFFPENNPYLNYALLYSKDFEKTLSNDDFSMPRQLSFLRLSYDINYDFVKELLSRANFTKI